MPDESEFEERLNSYNAAYGAGNEAWFDFFAPNATIYAIGEVTPILGLTNYKERFADLLRHPRQVHVLSRDLQVSGATAIAMQLLQVKQAGVTTIMRESTIWSHEQGTWRIVHSDTSLGASPVAHEAELAANLENVKVLGARLATSAAQVGIAQ